MNSWEYILERVLQVLQSDTINLNVEYPRTGPNDQTALYTHEQHEIKITQYIGRVSVSARLSSCLIIHAIAK